MIQSKKKPTSVLLVILVRLVIVLVAALDLTVFLLSGPSWWLGLYRSVLRRLWQLLQLMLSRSNNNTHNTATKLQSVAVGEATHTHGAPRRSALAPEQLVTGAHATVYEMTQCAIQEYGGGDDHTSKIALVSPIFIELRKLHEHDRFPSKVFDEQKLKETSYAQLGQNVQAFGAGLRKLGMEPIPAMSEDSNGNDDVSNLKGKFVMVIFEDTCEQWTTALHGAFSQSLTVATCYATLGEDAVVSAVNETKATTLLLNWKKATAFSKLADQMPMLKTIIASTHEMPQNTETPKSASDKIKIVSSDEVMQLGRDYPIAPVPPKSSDIAVIMYTSGSTNQPKGVVMRHSQLVAGVSGMAMNLDIRKGQEVFVSYLPLAHILALQVENGLLYYGSKICYSDPRMLSKTLPMYKPTVFAGVPKVWSLLKEGVEKKLSRKPILKLVFDDLVWWKGHVLRLEMDTPVSNLLFQTISKQVFGGRLRFGVTGGGPISANLQEFCRICFCCPLIQGYALTETCVGGCFQALDDTRASVVGPPVPCVEIVLMSEPDIQDSAGLPYLHTDTKDDNGNPILGRGEICFRGPCISSGYYNLPAETTEAYDEEGWFHSGDIGQFTLDGVIEIVDRKKNLVKLRGGEYVRVESMEVAFGQSAFVSTICIVANGEMDTPLALVKADNSYLENWASDHDIRYESLNELADKEETRAAVVQSMVKAGKEAGLTSLELRIKDCGIIVGDEWGPGHGMTASMKIDRKQIFKIYGNELKAMMKRNGIV